MTSSVARSVAVDVTLADDVALGVAVAERTDVIPARTSRVGRSVAFCVSVKVDEMTGVLLARTSRADRTVAVAVDSVITGVLSLWSPTVFVRVAVAPRAHETISVARGSICRLRGSFQGSRDVTGVLLVRTSRAGRTVAFAVRVTVA